jgi:anti-sigma factor ChrR (cupin superfamily)
MNSETNSGHCAQTELVAVYAVRALPARDAAALEAHISTCPICQAELAGLRAVVESMTEWPTDVLRPAASLWGRLAQRITAETGAQPSLPRAGVWAEPEWHEAAPGISCKVLARDGERNRVSMLVRLAPGIDYPPHRHAGVEELHLLAGELWINDRKLLAGDYNRAEPGSTDNRVWTETGCTCVLIASTEDFLG